jgi:hypothetical protein
LVKDGGGTCFPLIDLDLVVDFNQKRLLKKYKTILKFVWFW